ncbi:MAG: hypothetical protein KME06_09450 [Kastovskya adunca ATA6-11-RM4]|nr:hypothetical protein [Kastovskya adunca ATA6-11-RM4]
MSIALTVPGISSVAKVLEIDSEVHVLGSTLDNGEFERSYDIPINFSLKSNDVNLVGATLVFEVKHYTSGMASLLTTKTTSDDSIKIVSQTPGEMSASTTLEKTLFDSLPSSNPITLSYRIRATVDGLVLPVGKGSFVSKPESP